MHIPPYLEQEDLQRCKDLDPASIRRLFEEKYKIMLPQTSHTDLEVQTRLLAHDLYTAALEAGWRTTEAAALITPNIMVPLLTYGMKFSKGDRLLRRKIQGTKPDSEGISAFEALREDEILYQKIGCQMNWRAAEENGLAAKFSDIDARKGIRLHEYDETGVARLAYLYGILYAKGHIDNPENHVIAITVQRAGMTFLEEVLAPLVYELFHYIMKKCTRPRISSQAIYTHLRDDWHFIEESGRSRRRATIVSYEDTELWREHTTTFLDTYVAGLIAAKGLAISKRGHLPRIEFNDSKGELLSELEWAIEQLEEGWPAGEMRGGRIFQDRQHLNAAQLLALSRGKCKSIWEKQKGYLTHPKHLALLPAINEAAQNPANQRFFRI